MNRSIDFFEAQFRKAADPALNPFETLALPYVSGRVLDLGCGLGNLSVAAARRGCSVVALDGSPTAIAHLREVAALERLPINAERTELRSYRIAEDYDTIVAIGLLMFLPEPQARAMLADVKAHVREGGTAIVNVLTEGTTYFDMFEPGHYHLFTAEDIRAAFEGWEFRAFRHDRFAAPGDTVKAFVTVVANKPACNARTAQGITARSAAV